MTLSIGAAAILGITQGLTEFFPVSSSAHLILVPWLLGIEDPGLSFDVILHLGTLLALTIYFLSDWFRILGQGITSIVERKIGYQSDRLMFWYLILGTIPAGLAGLVFHNDAETRFRDPMIIAMTLSSVGFLLYWVDGRSLGRRTEEDINFKDVMLIGMAQALAIVPGVSRSGITMLAGRGLGLSREVAARFSFLLSFPIVAAASLKEVPRWLELTTGNFYWPQLAVGLIASFLSGMFAIHFLLLILKSTDFKLFAWYRIALATFLIFWTILK